MSKQNTQPRPPMPVHNGKGQQTGWLDIDNDFQFTPVPPAEPKLTPVDPFVQEPQK